MSQEEIYMLPFTLYMGENEDEFGWALFSEKGEEIDTALMESITGSPISEKMSKMPTDIIDLILTHFKEVFYESIRLGNIVNCLMFFNKDKDLVDIKLVPQAE